jgi:hypothetical protein
MKDLARTSVSKDEIIAVGRDIRTDRISVSADAMHGRAQEGRHPGPSGDEHGG